MVDFNEGREERVRAHLRTGGGAYGGVTMRDYFAAHYLSNNWCSCTTPSETAEKAYAYADAMIAERDKAYEAIRKQCSVEEAFGLGDSK